MSSGRVFLIGAGCGDRDLITLRGKALLEQAEVVLYDSLIDTRLLDFVPANAEKICVGKRAGQHSADQTEINRLLVEKASKGKTVIRLKGGDPFVFGRGGEEILTLSEHNIDYAVVPGISSAIAVPELAGIPVTHRGSSRSVHIITAHTKEDTLPEKIGAYAGLDGTLVFLMGLSRLSEIASALMKNGMSGNTPAAVISCGASLSEKVVRGTLENIALRAVQENLTAPAVIVVGEVAALELKIQRPSVSVVGTRMFSEKLRKKLCALGCNVQTLDLLQVAEYEENAPLQQSISRPDDYTAIVFTSANGVKIFFERLSVLLIDVHRLAHLRFAAVGSGTALALQRYGIYADITPTDYSAVSLARTLSKHFTRNDRLLLLRAEQGSKQLNEILDKSGVAYDDVKLYDIKVKEGVTPEHIDTDYLVFASPSGVRAFFDSGFSVSESTKVISIGNTTAHELKKNEITDILLPKNSTADGIVRLIEKELLCRDSDD